jgi:hypothetical protein
MSSARRDRGSGARSQHIRHRVSCAITGPASIDRVRKMVGVAGFEPATPSSERGALPTLPSSWASWLARCRECLGTIDCWKPADAATSFAAAAASPATFLRYRPSRPLARKRPPLVVTQASIVTSFPSAGAAWDTAKGFPRKPHRARRATDGRVGCATLPLQPAGAGPVPGCWTILPLEPPRRPSR